LSAWAEKYNRDGLVVIGVHTAEFAFEKDQRNVSKAVRDLKINYPIAIDSNYAAWKAFHNEYWPAHYFIDARGTIRYHHFGGGEYEESEEVISQLLKENTGLKAAGIALKYVLLAHRHRQTAAMFGHRKPISDRPGSRATFLRKRSNRTRRLSTL
jgi:hypothetical protein